MTLTPLTLELEGNPWHCDCHMAWIMQATLRDSVKHSFRCETPHSVHNQPIMSLHLKDPEQACPADSLLSSRLGIGVILLGCLLLTTIVLLLVLRSRKLICNTSST